MALFRDSGSVFPDEIECDESVLYHGTTLEAAQQIESEGLCPTSSCILRSEAKRVLSIYKKMDWSGIRIAGLGVLNAYTSNHDFKNDGDDKYLYLSLWANQAISFAHKDVAGGEKCRSIRLSLLDLDRYLLEPEIRHEHSQNPEKRFIQDQSSPASVNFDLEWLSRQIAGLASIREKSERLRRNFQNGVVYAIRLQSSEYQEVVDAKGMGMKYNKKIPTDRVVAKVILPFDFQPH